MSRTSNSTVTELDVPSTAISTIHLAMNGIPPNHIENGREFHGFRKGKYMYPCDEQEQDRLDIYHKLFLVARHDQLHKAPLTPNFDGPRILDLGTGTGIWAIDMADRYPTAEVVGLDLVNIQPQQIPPNLRFRVPRDFESPWSLGEESWDLIHLRMASGSVSSWPELYQKIFQHLKPRYGYVEQVEIDIRPRCDDGTLPENSPIIRWYNWLDDATGQCVPIRYQDQTCEMLRAQGFVDIEDTIIRLPINGWPSDPHQQNIGKWYNLGLYEATEAMGLGPLTRVYHLSAENVRQYARDVKTAVCNKNTHVYHLL